MSVESLSSEGTSLVVDEEQWRSRKRRYAFLSRAQRLLFTSVAVRHMMQRASQVQEIYPEADESRIAKILRRYRTLELHSNVYCFRKVIPKIRRHRKTGQKIFTNRTGNANVRVYYDKNGFINHVYWDVYKCKNGLFCPYCSPRLLAKHRLQIGLGMNNWRLSHPYGVMMFLTYTFPHTLDDVVSVSMSRMDDTLRSFRAGEMYQLFRLHYGEDGYIRALEATYGDNSGWHPHFHEIRLFDSSVVIDHEKLKCRKIFFKFVKFLKIDEFNYQLMWEIIERYISTTYVFVRIGDNLISDDQIIYFLNNIKISEFSVDFDFMIKFRPYYDRWQEIEVKDLIDKLKKEIYDFFVEVRNIYSLHNRRVRYLERYDKWVQKVNDSIGTCIISCKDNIPRKISLLEKEKWEIIDNISELKGHDARLRKARLREVEHQLDIYEGEIKNYLIDRWVDCCIANSLASEEQRDDMLRHSLKISFGVTEAQWDYLTKSIPWELTNPARTKECRASGRVSSWEVLRRATDNRLSSDTRDKYTRVWVDFLVAMQGRAVTYWSPGLKKRCGVVELKRSEGEILYQYSPENFAGIAGKFLPLSMAYGILKNQKLPDVFRRLLWKFQIHLELNSCC